MENSDVEFVDCVEVVPVLEIVPVVEIVLVVLVVEAVGGVGVAVSAAGSRPRRSACDGSGLSEPLAGKSRFRSQRHTPLAR